MSEKKKKAPQNPEYLHHRDLMRFIGLLAIIATILYAKDQKTQLRVNGSTLSQLTESVEGFKSSIQRITPLTDIRLLENGESVQEALDMISASAGARYLNSGGAVLSIQEMFGISQESVQYLYDLRNQVDSMTTEEKKQAMQQLSEVVSYFSKGLASVESYKAQWDGYMEELYADMNQMGLVYAVICLLELGAFAGLQSKKGYEARQAVLENVAQKLDDSTLAQDAKDWSKEIAVSFIAQLKHTLLRRREENSVIQSTDAKDTIYTFGPDASPKVIGSLQEGEKQAWYEDPTEDTVYDSSEE